MQSWERRWAFYSSAFLLRSRPRHPPTGPPLFPPKRLDRPPSFAKSGDQARGSLFPGRFCRRFVCRASWLTGFTFATGSQPGTLGGIFFGANILAGISALSAAWLAKRIGLVRQWFSPTFPPIFCSSWFLSCPICRQPSSSCCCGSASPRWMSPPSVLHHRRGRSG